MSEEEKWVKRLPRWTYESAVSQFKPAAPLPPNTLTNSDGTPYSADHDTLNDKQLAQQILKMIKMSQEKANSLPETFAVDNLMVLIEDIEKLCEMQSQ